MDINAYAYAKGVMSNKLPLTKKEIREARETINKFSETHSWATGYVLLCRELYDFTSFLIKDSAGESLSEVIIEIGQARGRLLDVYYDEEFDVLHIWIRIDNEPYLYRLMCEDWCVEVTR